MNPHLMRARLLAEQERHEQAIEEFEKAITKDPEDPYAYCGMAISLLRCDRGQQAWLTARMAVGMEPDAEYPHWVMALVQLERGLPKEAEESIRTAIELAPGDATNHGLLSRILLDQGRKEESLKAAEEGLSLDPGEDLCLTFRARALMELGRREEAHRVAEHLLSESPEDAWNHQLRGDQLLMEGKLAEAKPHYLEALRIDPRMESARYGLATCLKGRSALYGTMLGLLLRLGRMASWALWGGVVLMVVTLRIGNTWVSTHPSWVVPYEVVKSLLWMALVLVMIANPLFDVLLRFDREGRAALSEDEYRATNWYLACFAVAALCAVWALALNVASAPRQMGFAVLFLTRAIDEVYSATPGYVRRWMTWITGGVGAILLLTPVVGILGVFLIVKKISVPMGVALTLASAWMPLPTYLLATFADDLREWLERRRPDRGRGGDAS